MRVTCDADGCPAHYESQTFGLDDDWLSVSLSWAEWPLDYGPEHTPLVDDDGRLLS